MRLFDKWAIRRVERIKQREAEEQQERLKKQNEYKIHADAIYMVIETHMEELVQVYEKQPTHIKVGDRAIMNYFSIKYPSRNGWDGGVSSLLNHIPQEERTKPVTVIISHIYVDKSYARDIIDRFFENHSNEWLYNNVTIDRALNFYLGWLRKIRSTLPPYDEIRLFGLYKTAKFNYDGSFKPKWGLNVFSFHAEGTPEYTKTYELWMKEIEINLKRVELNKKLKELNDEMKQIDEEYNKIKVVNID